MNLEEVLQHRRAVRVYDPLKPVDTEKVRHCLQLATLAPTSSNMQLWEAYHLTKEAISPAFIEACLGQKAVSTASEVVVFVTRQDLYKQRAKQILAFEEQENLVKYSPVEKQAARLKNRRDYYGKLMPFYYARLGGLVGGIRKVIATTVGLFRPMVHQVTENDVRVVVHKSCGLAAQTFMIAMANEGYDTCPLEGVDTKRIKKLLQLPKGAEINMVISCGIRKGTEGIWGDRYRVPFEQVYHRVVK